MSNDHMDESTCTLHRSIPDRFDEVPTGHNVTCERINFTHEQQRQLLARQPFEQQNAAPPDLYGNHNGRPHDSIHTSFQPPNIANGLEADGTTNGSLGPIQEQQGHWEPYTDWLQSDDPVYWIAGHQRSGKSTLMRFLRDDKTVHTRTRLWASGSRLVKICFFLRQPTSYRDFLSELLYRAADGRPDMFNDLPPLRTQDEELVHVFEDTFDELGSGDHGKFLLMIDGVEHLEDGGNKLSMLLWGLLDRTDSPGSSLKVCVSTTYDDTSQLWQAFRPLLHMERLTRLDLWQTISDELNDNKEFCQLRKFDSHQAQDAVRLIVKHAQGSFLYARLAVAWLVAKLVETEDISRWCNGNPEAVKELFDGVPGTSDGISGTFEGIFKNILAHEWPSGPSAQTLFGLFEQAEREKEPLPLLVLSFAEEPYDEEMEPGVRAATCSEIEQRLDRMRRHLFIRCGGLLEAPDAGDDTMVVRSGHGKIAGERKDKTLEAPYPVDGALALVRHHEVVGEWKDKIWEIINNHSISPPPNPLHLQRDLCAAYLRRIKSLDTTQPTFIASFRSLATACLKYSIKIEEPLGKENGPGENPNSKILLALNKDAKTLLAMPQPCNAKSPKSSDSDPRKWSVKVQSNQHAYLTIHPHWTNICEIVNYQPPSSFFDFALQHGLYSIVAHYLKKRPNTNGNGNGTADGQTKEPERVHKLVSGRILPLTLIARTQHTTTANLRPISIKMARTLFKHGADPNYKQSSEAPGTTAWHALLKAMAAEMPKERSPPPPTTTTGGEQNNPATDGHAKPPTPEQLKGQARRIRLAQLAVLFLEHGADPYATVRQMEPSDGGAGNSNDKATASVQDKQSPVLLFVKGVATCIRDNVVAAARGVRSVPARLQGFRVRVKETKALTRDVDSQKLTVDEIVGAMWKSEKGVAMDEGFAAGVEISLTEQQRDFDDDAGGEEQDPSTDASPSEDDNASERAVARARNRKEAELWKRVMQAVQKKRQDAENRDKKIRKKVLRERAWERARLFAR
ncbi:hypothetical protein IWX90DRAFT_226163 [Phyllosticta citrichinensis]|uniref:Nephrocystin 3-like N-terminal domain-containing protein n=1 Tax=Phyllosticta citrichinensis TaxID=1130410 RepID=A0ABR1XUW1_9PEZI